MTEMSEALEAIEGKIAVSPEKIPPGKTIVAVQLARDEATSGRYMAAVKSGWRAAGMAVAVKDGRVVAANHLLGHISRGVPKVTACHVLECTACGTRVLTPEAVWAAKDAASKAGVDTKSTLGAGVRGMDILAAYGQCSCGGKWIPAVEHEKRVLTEFADRVLREIANSQEVGKFLPPRAFVVRPVEEGLDLGREWDWLSIAMARQSKAAVPVEVAKKPGDLLVYNPGFWLGWTNNHHDSKLFYVESEERGRRPRRTFNPGTVDGL